ncbi:MAG: hypothetical protein AAF433_15070 [Bacteroidota bacterium]
MSTSPDLDIKEEIGATVGYLEAYFERKVQLVKLDVAEKTAQTGASLATGLILVSLLPIVLTTLSIGLGFLLADLLQWSVAGGFLLLAAFYIVLGGLIFIFRRQLFTNPILSKLIRELFK